jgi:predicted amidohydrolase YtcJ
MAMNDDMWDVIQQYRSRNDQLPIWIAAHYLISPTASPEENLSQVNLAIELQRKYNQNNSPDCWITGIKLILDGVIDSCTAALSAPYTHNGQNSDPMWTVEELMPVLKRADSAGLQCALHAIGDKAIKIAIDSLEQVGNASGRHRTSKLFDLLIVFLHGG